MHQPKQETTAEPTTNACDVSRRDFIKGGVAAGLVGGIGLGSAYWGYSRSLADPVRIGVIGTGDEGSVLMGSINPDFVQVVAIADIRPYNIYRAFYGDESSDNALKVRPGLMRKYGWADLKTAKENVAVYEDQYEDLLADPNVEAVIVALPLHLHAEASIKAMRAGKHVLCEKLMAHSVHECKEMARVANTEGKLLAIGHQRHYSILYDQAKQMIQRGLIGDVHHIRAQWHRGNLPGRDSWQQPLPDKAMQKALDTYTKSSGDLLDKLSNMCLRNLDGGISSDFDNAEKERRITLMKMLDSQVDAAKYGYQVPPAPPGKDKDGKVIPRTAFEELIRWRLWNRTGGGLMVELGSHQLDAASIFVSAMRDKHEEDGHGVAHPLSVYGVGGRHIFPHDRDVDDHVYCAFEFPAPDYKSDSNKKIVVTYSSINGNGFGGFGETVMGTKGTLVLAGEKEVEIVRSGGSTGVSAAKGGGGPTLDTTESGAPAVVEKSGGGGPVSRGYTEEIEHWAWCIRNPAPENKPRCHAGVAMPDAVMALVSNIAIAEEKQIKFDPNWFDPDHDATPEGIKPNTQQDRYKV